MSLRWATRAPSPTNHPQSRAQRGRRTTNEGLLRLGRDQPGVLPGGAGSSGKVGRGHVRRKLPDRYQGRPVQRHTGGRPGEGPGSREGPHQEAREGTRCRGHPPRRLDRPERLDAPSAEGASHQGLVPHREQGCRAVRGVHLRRGGRFRRQRQRLPRRDARAEGGDRPPPEQPRRGRLRRPHHLPGAEGPHGAHHGPRGRPGRFYSLGYSDGRGPGRDGPEGDHDDPRRLVGRGGKCR